MSAPLLCVVDVRKNYGAVAALDGVSIDVGAGEFFALLGPSGCGKTTLMRCIAGFETPDSGRLTLRGADLAGVPPHRRPVNMMFQSYALFPHLELSGGQRQRVALARALAPRPALLLLDEPLGALDRKLREETQFQLKEIQRKTQTSFVIVTHDQDEALALADRVAVMRAGRVEQIASPVDIYERPATRFVAGFVGETNFVEGVVRQNDGASFETAFGRLPRTACALPDGARATLSVRPERIGVTRDGAGVAGRVEDFVFRGEYSLLRVRVAPGVALRVAAYEARFSIGDDVALVIAPDAGVLFAEEA